MQKAEVGLGLDVFVCSLACSKMGKALVNSYRRKHHDSNHTDYCGKKDFHHQMLISLLILCTQSAGKTNKSSTERVGEISTLGALKHSLLGTLTRVYTTTNAHRLVFWGLTVFTGISPYISDLIAWTERSRGQKNMYSKGKNTNEREIKGYKAKRQYQLILEIDIMIYWSKDCKINATK